MKFLAISGSVRKGSTNTVLLSVLAEMAAPHYTIEVFDGIQNLPIFSPDIEGDAVPKTVYAFATAVAEADGLIISSPEYVRAIPGGLKNAIDWLVPREELVNKPIALVHASHRGEDMLESLRMVLNTVTGRFDEASFLRLQLMSRSPEEIRTILSRSESMERVSCFLSSFSAFISVSKTKNTS